jgi:hypothetical protein
MKDQPRRGMTDKEIENLIRKTTKAVSGKRKETQQMDEERLDLQRLARVKAQTITTEEGVDLNIKTAPPEDLFRMMAKRDF